MDYEPDAASAARRLVLLNADTRPHFVLSDADLAAVGTDSTTALTKAALFAGHVIVVTKPCAFWTRVGYVRGPQTKVWEGNAIAAESVRYIQAHRSEDAFDSSFTIIPASITEIIEEREDEETWLTPERKELFSFESLYQRPSTPRISFSDPVLAFQMLESGSVDAYRLGINLWLPELRGLPLDTLLRLRADEQDSFARLHAAVQTILAGFEASQSDAAIKAVLSHADYEVRELERQLYELRHRYHRGLAESAVGFAIVACCMLLPSELAKAIIAFVGSAQARDGVRHILRHREQISDLTASDFYVASQAGGLASSRRKLE